MQRQAVVRAALCTGLMLAGAGCVTEKVSGETHTYTYAGWVPLLWFLVSVGAAGIGFLMLKSESNKSRGVWLILGGIAVLLLVAPFTLKSKVVVAADDVTINTGIFWPTAKAKVLKYDDMESFAVVPKEVRGRRGRKRIEHYLTFTMENGQKHEFDMGNALLKKARPALESAASKKGFGRMPN